MFPITGSRQNGRADPEALWPEGGRARVWRDSFALYTADDAESARLRAHHLGAVVRLTPHLMAANLVNAAIVAWAFHAVADLRLDLWLVALLLLAGLGLRAWARSHGRATDRASRRAMHRATRHAAALAAVWGAVPLLWFPAANPSQQLLVATLVTGMISAGAFVLSPLPAATLAYITILTVSSLIALARAGEPLFLLVAFLLLCYAVICALGAMAAARRGTALLRSRHEASRQGQMVSLLLRDFEEHAAEALWETDREGYLVHVSPRLAKLLAVEAPALRDATLLGALAERSEPAAAALRAAFDRGRPFQALRLPVPGSQAASGWWSLSGKPLFDPAGRIEGWRGVVADVSDEVRAQERLRQLAHFDSLTGLANRLTLHEALQAAMQRGQRGALVSLDLDHFKAINDSLGHSAGDAVLQAVAAKLKACVRPGDIVARLGGDEFAVLVSMPCTADEAMGFAQRIVVAFLEPCDVAGRKLAVGASVGVALFPEHGASVDELIGNADLALYDAKGAGRARQSVYAPALGERSRRRLAIEQGLREAIAQQRLALHWQPQVDIASWRIVGVEALLRWEHHELGRVSPVEFIAVAEQAGLIEELGAWVLGEACRTAVAAFGGLSISVNVSPAQLRDAGFPGRVGAALQASGLAAERLELEITESIFIDDADGAIERLQALQRLGVKVALDDFGTGYSSLAYLRRFPFNTLKIDRAFVRELLLREDVQAIVRMITQLAATLGMRTIAEGVETAEQLEVVAQSGCHEVQGYLVSRPCARDELVRLRAEWREGRGADGPRGLPPATLLH